MNFEYVVQRNEKKKICFGSTLERKLLEDDTKGLTSKLAKTYLRENLAIAPGMYDHSNVTSSINVLANRPTSNLGTVLGGRKAERKTIFTGSLTPAPGEYNLPSMLPEKYIQSCAPFNTLAEKKHKISNNPGVGTYNISASKHRTLNFKYSFGGKKCLFPIIKVKCGPYNFDECERCQKHPEGDYWYLEAIFSGKQFKMKKGKQTNFETFLCRPCYELEKIENKIYTKEEMQNFKKIRDCSKIHFHDGCKSKLFLLPQKEISKLKEREGYLSLYYK